LIGNFTFELMNCELAPIALFTYRRLDTLKITIDSLVNCKLSEDSELYIFSDGAKNSKDDSQVKQVRNYIRNITGFKKINFHLSDKNLGLANSIISGVSTILEIHESVIVLEDDLVFTSNFLQFMNLALNEYTHHYNVFSVSGYSFNLKIPVGYSKDGYFLNRGWSWGWATWRNRWIGIDWEIKDYDTFRSDRKAMHNFGKGGSDLNRMLKKQINGKIDSWAIRWFYHQYKVGGLTMYPILSKVYNNGFGDLSTHTKGSSKRYLPVLDKVLSEKFDFPKDMTSYTAQFQKKFISKMNFFSRIVARIQSFVILFVSKRN